MLIPFLITLGLYFLPPLLALTCLRQKENFYVRFPALVFLNALTVATINHATAHWLPYGGQKLLLMTLVSSAMAFGLAWLEPLYLKRTRVRLLTNKHLGLLALLSALASIDTAYILNKQGWGTAESKRETYFSMPFQHDAERATVIVNAILRGDRSPFLPASRLRYPSHWYHWAALVAGTLKADTRLPVVMGVALGTAFVFYFLCFWAFSLWKPQLLLRRTGLLLLFALVALHADIFHAAASLVKTGTLGIESDASFAPLFFRNFSPKLLAVTSPESLFSVLAILLLFVSFSRRTVFQRVLPYILMPYLALSAPLLFALLYPLVAIYHLGRESMVGKKPLDTSLEILGILVASLGLHWIVTGVPLTSIVSAALTRDGRLFSTGVLSPRNFLSGPFVPWACFGIAGFGILWSIYSRFGQGWRKVLKDPLVSIFLLVLIAFHVIFSGHEIRRLCSMLLALPALLIFFRQLPKLRMPSTAVMTLSALGALSLGLHFYFLYAHTGKPSVVDPKLPWKDYFAINQLLEHELRGHAVIATPDTLQSFPVVMQATTSFSSPSHAELTTQLNSPQREALRNIHDLQAIPSEAVALGYSTILWGPIEKRRWGSKVYHRFIHDKNLIAQRGEVALYRLEDHLQEKVRQEHPRKPDFHFHFADALSKGGWWREALRYYHEVVRSDPSFPKVYNQIGLALASLGHPVQAMEYFRKEIDHNPKFSDAYNNLGALNVLNNDFKKAIDLLSYAATWSRDPEIQINLALAYAGSGETVRAIQANEKALALNPSPVAESQALLALGDLYTKEQKWERALSYFERVLKKNRNHALAHVKIADIWVQKGELGKAKAHYAEALKIDPKFGLAVRGMAALTRFSS